MVHLKSPISNLKFFPAKEDAIRLIAIVVAIIAYLLAVAEVAAGQSVSDLVRPQLLASSTAIHPGRQFPVGLLLHITDGWHVYWSNPGDAGGPTTLNLTVPAGFRVSAVQYPV